MGAIARQGPHQVAQKSTSTGLSDFNTSWSKFASVTSTIPLPAIFFLLVVNAAMSADAPSSGVAGPGDMYECVPNGGAELPIVTLRLDAMGGGKSQTTDRREKKNKMCRAKEPLWHPTVHRNILRFLFAKL